jgi:hypothetical protein
MQTPEAAKELWCPMVRATSGSDHPGNAGNSPDYRNPVFSKCIADKCAMWRWAYTTESVPADIEGPSGAIVRTFEQRVTQTQGYCGLAPMAQI